MTANLIVGQEQSAHLSDIEPAVRRALHRPKIEIETVNVDACSGLAHM